jgi:hypothetical protein
MLPVEARAESTNGSTDSSPRAAICCYSSQPKNRRFAATSHYFPTVTNTPSGLLIPRSQVRSLPGPLESFHLQPLYDCFVVVVANECNAAREARLQFVAPALSQPRFVSVCSMGFGPIERPATNCTVVTSNESGRSRGRLARRGGAEGADGRAHPGVAR